MKQSIINDYLKALKTLVNDNNIAFDDKYYIRDYCDRYIATYNFNQTILFSL